MNWDDVKVFKKYRVKVIYGFTEFGLIYGTEEAHCVAKAHSGITVRYADGRETVFSHLDLEEVPDKYAAEKAVKS